MRSYPYALTIFVVRAAAKSLLGVASIRCSLEREGELKEESERQRQASLMDERIWAVDDRRRLQSTFIYLAEEETQAASRIAQSTR